MCWLVSYVTNDSIPLRFLWIRFTICPRNPLTIAQIWHLSTYFSIFLNHWNTAIIALNCVACHFTRISLRKDQKNQESNFDTSCRRISFSSCEVTWVPDNDGAFLWWPETPLYALNRPRAFEIFAWSRSTKFFDKTKALFGIMSKEVLTAFLDRINTDPQTKILRWRHFSYRFVIRLSSSGQGHRYIDAPPYSDSIYFNSKFDADTGNGHYHWSSAARPHQQMPVPTGIIIPFVLDSVRLADLLRARYQCNLSILRPWPKTDF